MAPIDLYVDISELGRVQQELSSLLSAMIDLGGASTAQADEGSMGSRDVAAAVHRFLSGWTDGRERIIESLRACQSFAAAAVDQYSETETKLTQGLQHGTGEGAAGASKGGGSGW